MRYARGTHSRLVGVLVACAAALSCLLVPSGSSSASAVRICRNGVCDGEKDPSTAREDKALQSATQWGREIGLRVSFADGGMAWAGISNGTQNDPVWLDRTFDGGMTWEPHLGLTSIPAGATGGRTRMYWIGDVSRPGMVRACGKAGDRPEVACTAWLPVCRDGTCDGAEPAGIEERAVNPHGWAWYRKITLHVAAPGRTAWASIDNGDPEGSPPDEVWIDRSWTSGNDWDGRLGHSTVPPGHTSRRTGMYNFEASDPAPGRMASLRACGKAGNRPEIACTPWLRAGENPPDLHRGAVDALMVSFDHAKGMWGPGEPEKGIWLSANAFTALLDYMARTGDLRHAGTISELANHHPGGVPAHTFEDFYDDFAWWALAWVRAYDITGDRTFLDKAESIAATVRGQWTTGCGGGIKWRASDNVKNLITNTLYMKLAASLYRRGRNAGWLTEAQKVVSWIRDTDGGRMLYDPVTGLMKDGVYENPTGTCVYSPPVGANTYTYLQGTMIGGLTELYCGTNDTHLLDWATAIANATTSRLVSSSGVLYYAPEEQNDGLKDETTRAPSDDTGFKGATVRNLRELYDVSAALGRPVGPWRSFLSRQRQALTDDDRSGWAGFGIHWAGPIRLSHYITFGSQLSAVDAFNAAHDL